MKRGLFKTEFSPFSTPATHRRIPESRPSPCSYTAPNSNPGLEFRECWCRYTAARNSGPPPDPRCASIANSRPETIEVILGLGRQLQSAVGSQTNKLCKIHGDG